jgi:hypothetical protein
MHMDELIRRFIENGFADFEGLHITGTVPVRQEIVNEVIAAVLKGEIPLPGSSPSSNASGGENAKPKPKLPLADLVKLVQRAEVQADDGRVIVTFEVRR